MSSRGYLIKVLVKGLLKKIFCFVGLHKANYYEFEPANVVPPRRGTMRGICLYCDKPFKPW